MKTGRLCFEQMAARLEAIATRLGLADLERAVTTRLCELVMATMLDLTGFEWAEARFLELEMWAILELDSLERMVKLAVAVSLCELAMAVKLNLGGLERMVRLTAAARLCELRTQTAVMLNLDDLEQEAVRLRSDGIERAAAGLRGLCELAAKPNLDDLERAAAGLGELGTQTAVVARLSVCGVVRTGVVCEVEVEIRVACRPRKTTHRCLRCVYVAEGGVCQCYVELDACGKSVAAVHLSCALSRARALVAR